MGVVMRKSRRGGLAQFNGRRADVGHFKCDYASLMFFVEFQISDFKSKSTLML